MKWRSSLAYLLVLLLVGGYYYYFEVVQKREKEMAAKEVKKIFHFQPDSVTALTLKAKDRETVQLKKEERWELVEPLKTEADKFSVHDLIDALSKLEVEREIIAAPGDLKPFGLLEPSLTIRFQSGEQGYELLVGEKNPVGEGSYAKTADSTKVFLLAEGNRSALTRGLNDLRKRQLFSFQLDEVAAVTVTWRDGNTTTLEQASGEKGWRAPASPHLKIKKSKVDNLIEQVHWLRAQGFLENEPKNLPSYGLEPPLVTVTMQLKAGGSAELRLAEREKDDKQLAALSSQLPAVVQVAASILDDLPRNLFKLQDRSILGSKPDEVKAVAWTLNETQGRAVPLDEDRWGLQKADRQPDPIKEPWLMRSLLWDLSDAEYQQKLDPAPPVVAKPYCRIELRNAAKNLLLTMNWEKPPEEGRASVPLWLEREGESLAVTIDAETLRRVAGNLERLSQTDQKVQ
jgi:ribosomal protein L23